MKRFHTGMITLGYPAPTCFPLQGKGWTLYGVESDPFGGTPELRKQAKSLLSEDVMPQEVVVEAPTRETALRANELLWGALALIHSGPFFPDFVDLDSSLLEDVEEKEDRLPPGRHVLQINGVENACLIAAKASFRRSTVYALSKHHFSVSLCSAHIVDLDPAFATKTFPKCRRPIHQVQVATAIVLAYGAIEELGLEVRASNSKPSCLSDGTWNPVVRENLEQRLLKAGVDLSEPVNWQFRGPRTTLETSKPRQIYRTSKKSPWARWSVRDQMVDIVDAIAHLSWLRSQVSSHRIDPKKARGLSMYDVTNGQFLARRLILERLVLWRDLIGRRDDD